VYFHAKSIECAHRKYEKVDRPTHKNKAEFQKKVDIHKKVDTHKK